MAELCSGQRGLITAPQLRVGIGTDAISYRVRQGRLHVVHRGIYLAGHSAITPLGRLTAAILACGPNALLSHCSAAWLWGLIDALPDLAEVTLIGSRRRGRAGIRTRRCREPLRRERRLHQRLPVTSPALTILDLAAEETGARVEHALNEARVNRLVRDGDFVQLARRFPGRTGWGPLGALLEAERGPDFTRSRGELRLVHLLQKARLPEPRRNVRVHGYELDCYWPELALAVEVDGYATHSTRQRFETDRSRDADLSIAGVDVLRFTWRQLTAVPEWVIARIAAAIALRTRKPEVPTT